MTGASAIGDFTVRPLGLGTMSLTGRGTWGEPPDPAGAKGLLRRAAELGVQLFDTADSYGPEVAENLVIGVPFMFATCGKLLENLEIYVDLHTSLLRTPLV